MNTLESAIPSLSAIRKSLTICSLLFLCATSLCAVADQELSPVAKVLDYEITLLEGDIIPLAEAMPADKYDFAPTAGEFKGVRTFAEQVSHKGFATVHG